MSKKDKASLNAVVLFTAGVLALFADKEVVSSVLISASLIIVSAIVLTDYILEHFEDEYEWEDKSTCDSVSNAVVVPNVYSILVNDEYQAKTIFDAGIIDFGVLRTVPDEWFYPTDLCVENGKFKRFCKAETSYSVKEWLALIKP